MPTSQISVERFSVISAKPFDDVLAAIDAAIGHPNVREMQHGAAVATTFSEMESVIDAAVGPTGLMEFLRFDMGNIVTKGKQGKTARSIRLLVGNPLIMRRMAEHVPDAASYAPVTILIDERADGVHLTYDRMTSFLASYKNAAASDVATDLDRKIETLLVAVANYGVVGGTLR